ncbi:MAG TPA: hypothetical protein P5044_01325 [bacterium]|nr:hypothetical protein [bacterium]
MSKTTARIIGFLIAFIIYLIISIRISRRRKKQKLLKEGYLAEFDCELISALDKVASRVVLAYQSGMKSNVLLFDNHIAFATGVTGDWQPEIMISEINSVKMEKLLWKELLFIDHNAKFVEEGKTKKYENQFYLSGDKDELLYIKDFIEERMSKSNLLQIP